MERERIHHVRAKVDRERFHRVRAKVERERIVRASVVTMGPAGDELCACYLRSAEIVRKKNFVFEIFISW